MRYREGAPPETAAAPAIPDDMVAAAAGYTLAVGVGLLVAGMRARLKWVTCLGVALILTSGGYFGASFLGLA